MKRGQINRSERTCNYFARTFFVMFFLRGNNTLADCMGKPEEKCLQVVINFLLSPFFCGH